MTTAKENFCTVITSREYATMMLNWFKQLWKVSGEYKPENCSRRGNKEFIEDTVDRVIDEYGDVIKKLGSS